MTVEERLTDLFQELDRRTVVPHDLRARIDDAIDAPRRVSRVRTVVLVAAAVIAAVAVPTIVDRTDDDVIVSGPLATVPADVFNDEISPVCTAAARALTAVGPRFTTAAAYEAAGAGLRRAVAPVIEQLLAAVPPGDDPSLPARKIATLRAAEARSVRAAEYAAAEDFAAAGAAFDSAMRLADESLLDLVAHGARCSVIGTED